jgi:hypothetical protein
MKASRTASKWRSGTLVVVPARLAAAAASGASTE